MAHNYPNRCPHKQLRVKREVHSETRSGKPFFDYAVICADPSCGHRIPRHFYSYHGIDPHDYVASYNAAHGG